MLQVLQDISSDINRKPTKTWFPNRHSSLPVRNSGVSFRVAAPGVFIAAPTATALSAPVAPLVSFIMVALARRRLDVSVMLVARVLGTVVAFALTPDLSLCIHILAAARAR